MTLNLVIHPEWRIAPVQQMALISHPVGRAFLHHTAVDDPPTLDAAFSQVQSIDRQYREVRGYPGGSGYTILYCLIGQMVHTFPCRAVWQSGQWHAWQGAHTAGFNSTSVAVCAMANFADREASALDVEAAALVLGFAQSQGMLSDGFLLDAHADAPGNSTACPVSMRPHVPEVRAAVGGAPVLPFPGSPSEEDDMDFAIARHEVSGAIYSLVGQTGKGFWEKSYLPSPARVQIFLDTHPGAVNLGDNGAMLDTLPAVGVDVEALASAIAARINPTPQQGGEDIVNEAEIARLVVADLTARLAS